MKGYPLTNEISVQELLRMRNEYGMSNPEIAAALDVSVQTIRNYIGKGPRSKNINRGGAPMPAAEIKKEEPVQGCLKVEPSVINLSGAYGKYTINEQREVVFIITEHDGFEVNGCVPISQLPTFIRELQAIERNIGKAKPKLEVW